MAARARRLLRGPSLRKLQWTRRTVQLGVVGFIIAIPILGHYGNYLASRELDALLLKWRGSPQGEALLAVDAALRNLPDGETERGGKTVRDADKALERIRSLNGNVWSAKIYGVSLTDPLAAAESFAASRRAVNVLILGLLIPLAVTLLLGRVFCSWLCPMNLLLELTGRLRVLLGFLELPTFNVRFPRATKFAALALGLSLAYLWAVPVLGSLYPPAVISRELRGATSAMFAQAEAGTPGWTWTGLSVASVFILGIVLFELLVSRRWWCRYMCPGGALYSLLGRFRLVRVARDSGRCTSCGACVEVCGMGLAPMKNRMGMECDNCGLCVSHCSSGALGFRLGLELPVVRKTTTGAPVLLAALLLPQWALAHHILGIPHYAYDESYPQAPVITYRTEAGPYEARMTGYPGRPVPGERTTLHVYITHRSGGKPFDGTVTLRVIRDSLLGPGDVIYGPVPADQSEGIYKFYPTFDSEDNFLVRFDFRIDDALWTIDLPMVVGDPGSPLAALGVFLGALAILFVIVRAVRIKLRRKAAAVSGQQ